MTRSLALAALVFALARVASAQCACTISDPGCPSNCATCTTQTSCCTCDTQCALIAPQCSAGYTSLGTQQCTSVFQSQRECQDCATVSTGQCSSCFAGYFGLRCQACPPGQGSPPCSGHGTCSDGISGSGSCTCATGYAGMICDQCAIDFVAYPNCGSICGDVTDDGAVDPNDVALFRAHLASPTGSPLSANGAAKCTVAPLVPTLPPCDILDVTVIRRSLQSPPLGPGRAPVCPFVSP